MSFVANRSGIGQVAASVEVRAGLRKQAEAIADRARQLARSEAYDTGAYYDSIAVVDADDTDRARVLVIADIAYATVIEYGTGDTPRFRILGRAADVKGT